MAAGSFGRSFRVVLSALSGKAFQQSGFRLGQEIGHGCYIVVQRFSNLQGDPHVYAEHRAIGGKAKLTGDA
jgi:hypothetical protein